MNIEDRITNYLELGGLFNPEMMDPEKVRNLLMDCRAEFAALKKEKSIADRCFDYWSAEDELFDLVQEILGGRPTEECLSPDFQFKVSNTWTDYYDGSIEVVLTPNTEPMTREQADAILALGFYRIYESQGERGVLWGKTICSTCNPKTGNEDQRKEAKLRVDRDALRAERDQLLAELQRAASEALSNDLLAQRDRLYEVAWEMRGLLERFENWAIPPFMRVKIEAVLEKLKAVIPSR